MKRECDICSELKDGLVLLHSTFWDFYANPHHACAECIDMIRSTNTHCPFCNISIPLDKKPNIEPDHKPILDEGVEISQRFFDLYIDLNDSRYRAWCAWRQTEQNENDVEAWKDAARYTNIMVNVVGDVVKSYLRETTKAFRESRTAAGAPVFTDDEKEEILSRWKVCSEDSDYENFHNTVRRIDAAVGEERIKRICETISQWDRNVAKAKLIRKAAMERVRSLLATV
jgi:hypothetical protein